MQTELSDRTDDAVVAGTVSVFTVQQARDLVSFFARVTTEKDVEGFLRGFTEDCVVQYGEFPTMVGKAAFRPFVVNMFSHKLKDFVCRKTLRTLNANVIGGTWTADWTDADSGNKKSGRGFEFWIMRGQQIARWDAAFNAWTVK